MCTVGICIDKFKIQQQIQSIYWNRLRWRGLQKTRGLQSLRISLFGKKQRTYKELWMCKKVEEGIETAKELTNLQSDQNLEKSQENNTEKVNLLTSQSSEKKSQEKNIKSQSNLKIIPKKSQKKPKINATQSLEFWNLQNKKKIITIINQKFFSQKVSKFEVVQAMNFLDEMMIPLINNNSCTIKIRNKVRYIFEEFVANKIKQIQISNNLQIQEILKILKSLGIANRIICYNFQSAKLEQLFEQLFIAVVQKGEALRVPQIMLLASATGNFKMENSEKIKQLFEIVKKLYEDSSNPLVRAQMLQALTKIRYCELEFQKSLEFQLSNQFIFAQESHFFYLIDFLVTFGIKSQYKQLFLEYLFDQYLKIKNRLRNQYPLLIYNFTLLGASNQLIQKISDETFGKMDQIYFQNFSGKKRLKELFLTHQLQKGTGRKVRYPPQIQQNIDKKQLKISLNYGFRTNEVSLDMFRFFREEFPNLEIYRGQIILNDLFKSAITIKNKNTEKNRICVEFRFASQYLISEPRKLLGQNRTILQILYQNGWNVIVVDVVKLKKEGGAYKQNLVQQIKAIFETECVSKLDW